MILIADSGSTKTDWLLASSRNAVAKTLQTEGITPVHMSETDIRRVLYGLELDANCVDSVYFYGSGLRPEYQSLMRRLLSERFVTTDVEAESDLLGAARALCGRSEGIACILGTGANSCLFDGHRIVANTPALGYVLGDEGSGAVIGRNLLNALYKGRLPGELLQRFEAEQHTTLSEVIQHVYREPLANRYLASLTHFISDHKEAYPELSQLVVDCMTDFLRCNIAPYGREDLKVSAVGSIAWFFQTELAHAASLCCMQLGTVSRSPLKGLLDYHFPSGR